MKINYIHIGILLMAAQSTLAAPPVGSAIPLFQIPPAPIQRNEAPKIEIDRPTTPPPSAVADTKTIRVNEIQIRGEKVYEESELIALTGFVPGSDLTLTDLRFMTVKIADFYRERGYFLAQAYLPAQTIKNGVVTITVIVGEYGNVTINNQTRLSDGIANNLISGLDSGDLIESGPLETRLLLLSDVPGVIVNSTLVPGSTPGTSDLNVDLTPGPLVSGSIEGDNAGLPATGAFRLGATVNINNLAGLGDVASLRVLSSGPGMTYGRASYQIQAGRGTVGVAYTQINYALGKQYSDLGIHGSAKIASVYGSYPLIRSRATNLYAQLGLDSRAYQENFDSADDIVYPKTTDKHANVLMPGIYGDHRDSFGGGGLTSYGAVWSFGNLNIQTAAARAIDSRSQGPKTNGAYNKLAFNGMRLQNVMDTPFSLYGAVNGQIASKNLNIWEKMELGGMYGVRAYPAGTAFGDQGYIVNLEVRYLLPAWSAPIPGRVSLIALYDTGSVIYNKNPLEAGNNTVTLNGAGVGLTWADLNNFTVKGYYAHKIGNTPATLNTSATGQFWIQLVKYF
ncbi:ShlB/FhaC/HecB family hemolysin secretion/activation protein [Polynucleobacter arcticus]|uniref:Peptide transporter n=1 Tax=Polynucleobacter arcticus TaxID=1743165 RepID=A0A6M9PM74_9BURK|nr:ShlB/FhaC/HecB family hemolysin secretion/activation protein [Polynucleobacter arcticus]QKM59867.1 peptide transporter [Polynucleobacter arcticus]